jgi:hypothetical protein
MKSKKWTNKNLPGIFSDFIATNVHRINGGKNKGEFCRDLRVDVLIDDYQGFTKECADLEIQSILFSQPWNENLKTTSEFITRARSWKEIPQIIKNY